MKSYQGVTGGEFGSYKKPQLQKPQSIRSFSAVPTQTTLIHLQRQRSFSHG
jgi:hypothetical protein